jgi:2-methylisocitrate lyase-like PEP mutase family enzyme
MPLRALIESSPLLVAPFVYDALQAKIAEAAGNTRARYGMLTGIRGALQ